LVRRRRSRESDAGSGKRRLIFCPSPFAAVRLPFAPPSSLPSFCARSVCPPHPFPLPFAFVAVFLSFASTGRLRFFPAFSLLDWVPMRPFPGKTLSARAFRPGATRPRCERSRGVPAFHRVAGLALGNPDRSRRWIPPGPGGPKAARRPHGRAVPLVVSLMVSLVVSLRVGSVEGDRARPGFSGRPGVPSGGRMGPGDGSRRGWEAGGGAAASWPSSAISGITNGIISGITKGGERGQDRARPGFSGRLRGKEPCQVPDPGDSLKTPSWSTRQGSTAFRGFLRIRRTRPGRVRYAAGWVKGEGDPFGRVLAGRGWAVTRRRRASPAGMKFLEGFGLRGRDRRTAAGPPA